MKKSSLNEIRTNLPKEDYIFPKYIILEPTNVCNLACAMCPSKSQTRDRGVMEMPLFQKIADEVATRNPECVMWPAIMGEALVAAERFFEMLEYSQERRLRIAWNTNAELLTDEMIGCIGNLSVEEVTIGLDAMTKEVYDRIRCGGDFDRVVDNVRKMLSQRWEQTRITVQFITQDDNAHEEDRFVRHWLKLGAVVKVRQKLGWGKGVEANNLTIPQEERDMPCPWLLRTMSIHWNGKVAQCDADWNGEYIAGDINTQTIQEVWQGELARRRERHRDGDFSFEPCSFCNDWQAGLSEFFFPDGADVPVVQKQRIGPRA